MKSNVRILNIIFILSLITTTSIACSAKGGASPTAEPTFEPPTAVPTCPPDVANRSDVLEGDMPNYDNIHVYYCVPTEKEATAIADIICKAVFPEVDFSKYTVHVCYAPAIKLGYASQWVVSYSRINEEPSVDDGGLEVHINKWNAEVTYLSFGQDKISLEDLVPTENEAAAIVDVICKAALPKVDYSKYTVQVNYSNDDEEWTVFYCLINASPFLTSGGGPLVHIKKSDGEITRIGIPV